VVSPWTHAITCTIKAKQGPTSGLMARKTNKTEYLFIIIISQHSSRFPPNMHSWQSLTINILPEDEIDVNEIPYKPALSVKPINSYSPQETGYWN